MLNVPSNGEVNPDARSGTVIVEDDWDGHCTFNMALANVPNAGAST